MYSILFVDSSKSYIETVIDMIALNKFVHWIILINIKSMLLYNEDFLYKKEKYAFENKCFLFKFVK